MKLKNSNCDETQTKDGIDTQNSNCDKTKNSNCDETLTLIVIRP